MAMKHLPDDPAFAELRRQLGEEHQPVGFAQEMVIDDMAFSLWKARRFQEQLPLADPDTGAKIDNLVAMNMRGYRNCLTSLELLRKIAARQGRSKPKAKSV